MCGLKGLYVIADSSYIKAGSMADTVAEILAAGVRIIQYRDKTDDHDNRHTIASELKHLVHEEGRKLIINDDVLLAKSIDADGVHLGQGDCSISKARKILGPNKIIGASCYNQFDNALHAVAAGADYVAFGGFSRSATKPDAARAGIDLISRAKKELRVPVCAIGGITKENIKPLLQAGADMIAVISAIFAAPSPQQATRELQALFK